jgi:hypothetical protein
MNPTVRSALRKLRDNPAAGRLGRCFITCALTGIGLRRRRAFLRQANHECCD